MKKYKIYKNKEWLYEQYWNNKKSMSVIAKEVGCYTMTIYRWFKTFNIPIRSKSEALKGKNNARWSGDEFTYTAIHKWLNRNKPKPDKCEECGKMTKKLDCHCISEKYTRDINDYMWLCRICHMEKDGRIDNRNEMGQFGLILR